jgi:hypothetical protein
MFNSESQLIRFRESSVEQILNWLDESHVKGEYNIDEEVEKLLLARNSTLLDAALAEYSTVTKTLNTIYDRSEIPIKRLCLKRVYAGYFTYTDHEFPFNGTIIEIFSKSGTENGLLRSFAYNPTLCLDAVDDIVNKNNEFSEIHENIWREFIYYLSGNPQFSKNSKRGWFDEDYAAQCITKDIWNLSMQLDVSESNAEWLAQIYRGLRTTDSSDEKVHKEESYFNADDNDDSCFIVENAIQRWKSVKNRSLCLIILSCLSNDTKYFNSLCDHDDLDFRKYYYRHVDIDEIINGKEECTEILDMWLHRDGAEFFRAAIQNNGVVSYSSKDWFKKKIAEISSDFSDANWLEADLVRSLNSFNHVPEHLRADANITLLDADAKIEDLKQERLQQQINNLYLNLLGNRDMTDGPMHLGDDSSIQYLAAQITYIKNRVDFVEQSYLKPKILIIVVASLLSFIIGLLL